MDNFKRRSRDNSRRVIDGIVNAPVRSQGMDPPQQGRRPLRFDGLRSTGARKVDDFRRADGFHTSQNGVRTSIGSPVQPQKTDERKPSLLHMSLQNIDTAGSTKKKFNKRRATKEGDKPSRWRAIRKWGLRSALALTVIALLLGGFLVFKGFLKVNKVFKGGGNAAALENNVQPELLKGEGDGRVNMLMFGKGGTGHAGADLTDTLIVASIDPVNKTSTLVSIPRDLWVTVPGGGSSKINAVYANAKNRSLNTAPKDRAKAEQAGVEAIKQMVSQVLGVPIHYYGVIDFEGFKQAVDIVGGVDINVPEELAVKEHLWDGTTGRNYYLNVPAGQQHFDSTKALYFTRSRHTSLRGDFTRSERQRLFIQALSQKILSAGTYSNPLKISQLMSALGDHISTDLSVNNALRLMEIGKGIDVSQMKSIGLADPPNNFVRTDNVNGQSVVRPSRGFGDYSDIQNFIRNTLKDPYLAKENAVLSVLNGTATAGLATKQADLLKSYGYNVTVIADAPTQDYVKTTLVDMTGGKKPFTKSYLEKRLGVKAVNRLPDATIQTTGIDFVVILGQN